jgi:predicted membrane protein
MSLVRGIYLTASVLYVLVIFIFITSLRDEFLPFTFGISMALAGRFLYVNTRRHDGKLLYNVDQELFPAGFFLCAVLFSFVEVLHLKGWLW